VSRSLTFSRVALALVAGASVTTTPAFVGHASAADAPVSYPSRPVRMVSPFAPGGNTDMVGRTIAPRLAERLGQNVLVDNRPGAGGMIGTAAVAKSLPDGHTLLFASGAFTSVAATASKMPYDPVKDFAWITVVITYPFVVVVRNDSPVRTAAGLVELARRNPGKLNYGSVGIGSVFHLATELFNSMANTDMLHVPFKGSAEPMTELMAGRLDVIFGTLTGAYSQIQANRVRALAVTSLERSPQLPDTPTMAETLPGYEVTSFAGVAAPRATPRPIVDRLNRELHTVLKQPDIGKLFAELGGSLKLTTPAEADVHVRGEIEKWRRIVATRKIEVQ
jgi:tripartite-type tricarboxylate transporter receptor subunit TctC